MSGWIDCILLAVAFVIVLVVLFLDLPSRRKRRLMLCSRTNRDARKAEILARSAWHRDQLRAEALEFADLHNARPGSDKADVLMGCVLDGDRYELALRILERMQLEGRE